MRPEHITTWLDSLPAPPTPPVEPLLEKMLVAHLEDMSDHEQDAYIDSLTPTERQELHEILRREDDRRDNAELARLEEQLKPVLVRRLDKFSPKEQDRFLDSLTPAEVTELRGYLEAEIAWREREVF